MQYSITFDTDGGTAIPKQQYYFGELIKTPPTPTKVGYSFDGWDFQFGTTMPSHDIVVTAQWRKIHTITYDHNLKNYGGAEGIMENETVLNGDDYIVKNCGYSKSFWTFVGWATSPNGAVEYSSQATISNISSDMTLYAGWQKLQ